MLFCFFEGEDIEEMGFVRMTKLKRLHDQLDKGTLKAIIRQASKFVSIDALKKKFYV